MIVRSVLTTNHEMVLEDHRSLREKKQVATINMEGTGETLETEIVHERSIDGQGIRVTKVDQKEGPGKMAKDNEVESGTTKSVTSEAWNEDKSEMSQDEAAHFLEDWLKLWAPQIDETMVGKYQERASVSNPLTLTMDERPDSEELGNDDSKIPYEKLLLKPYEKEGTKALSMLAIPASGEEKEVPLTIDESHSQFALLPEIKDCHLERTSAFKPSISLLGQAIKEEKTDGFISDPIKSIILGQRHLGQVYKEEKVRQLFVSGQLQKEEKVSRASNTKSLDKNADVDSVSSICRPGKIAKEEKVRQLWISGQLKKEERVSRVSNPNSLAKEEETPTAMSTISLAKEERMHKNSTRSKSQKPCAYELFTSL